MTREEAIDFLKAEKFMNVNSKYRKDWNDASDMAIEALSQPNYETDTEVRLSVTNKKKEKVILWDSFGSMEYVPSAEAVSREECNCVFSKPKIRLPKKAIEFNFSNVEIVVRCKDCKHSIINKHDKPLCSCVDRTVKLDDFCSWGERKGR